MTPEEKPAVYRQALEQCIDRELLFEEAVARGLSVSDQAVLAAFDQARVEHPDDEGWTKFLREQGLTADGYKAEIRTEKMVLALLKQESDKIPPASEAEIKTYFDENPSVFDSGPRIRARHILIPVSRLATAQGKALTLQKRVDPVLKRLRSGEDFARVAREVSTDAAASRGGDIGVVRRGQLAKALEDRAFELKPGEMTGAVETPAGYEIVKVEERLPAEKLAFEQARTRLQTLLWDRKRDVSVQALVDSLRAKAIVERLF